MRIAYISHMIANLSAGSAFAHLAQVAAGLMRQGHVLYSHQPDESSAFVRLSTREFVHRGSEIDAFNVRKDGYAWADEISLLRCANRMAPCVWEINAPVEELRAMSVPEAEVQRLCQRRGRLATLVDAAVCVSTEMEEHAKEQLQIPRTLVVPNGSDPQVFSPNPDLLT